MNLAPTQQEAKARICAESGVVRLAVFGSRDRDVGRHDSDLDLLVEFEPGRAPSFLGLARLAEAFSEVFDGLPVDLRTPRELSRHFREEVVRSAEVIFAL